MTVKTDAGLRAAFKRALRRPVYVVDGQTRTMRNCLMCGQVRAHIKSTYPTAAILNDLPFDDAFTMFKETQQ